LLVQIIKGQKFAEHMQKLIQTVLKVVTKLIIADAFMNLGEGWVLATVANAPNKLVIAN